MASSDESVSALFEKLGDCKHDYANISGDENLEKILKRQGEKLQFSCRCIKLKKKMFTTMKADRILVISEKALYNFRPSDNFKVHRWRLELYGIAGLVVSKESNECVVQLMSQKEGYRFQLGSCLHGFVETIANSFKYANEIELPLEVTEEKDLEKYVRQMKPITIASTSASAMSIRSTTTRSRFSLTQRNRPASPSDNPVADSALMLPSQKTEAGGRQGWLSKRKGDKDQWDAKYVVLSPDSLRYFTPKLKGQFDLKQCRAMARSSSMKMRKPPSEMQLPVLGDHSRSGNLDTPSSFNSYATTHSEAKRSFSAAVPPSNAARGLYPVTLRESVTQQSPNNTFSSISGGDRARSKADSMAALMGADSKGSQTSATFPRNKSPFNNSRSPHSMRTSSSVTQSMAPSDVTCSDDTESLRDDECRIWPFYVTTPNRTRTVEVAAGSHSDLKRWLEAFAKVGMKSQETRARHWLVDGWLWKKNPHESAKNNWRKRYFIIHGETCYYFEMQEKGCLNLAEGVSCSKTKIVRPTLRDLIAGIPSDTQFSYRFNVNDAGRFYPFAADSRQDMDDWIMSVNTMSKEVSRSLRRGGSRVNDVWASLKEKAPEGRVTIVFSGVQGVSDLWNAVDNAAMGVAIELHDRLLREMLRKFRGYEVKTEGTTFMVAFFTAWEALAWCLAVQEALVTVNWPAELVQSELAKDEIADDGSALFCGMRLYMGMQVGLPKGKRAPTTGRMDYYGPSVNKSARVAHSANGGQVLVTSDVLEDIKKAQQLDAKIFPEGGGSFALRDLGWHGLKGIKRPTHIFEVLPRSLAARSKMFGEIHSMGPEQPPADGDGGGGGEGGGGVV
mmetsp:Transcript_30938/g.49762  ORF Transcript_30938/g.49762 Transcript_30938/m.49762 type:complete len:843 (-) Transcript_30938:1-2529(-)